MSPPLSGLSIVVTRPERQATALVARLRAEGADVRALPLIATAPVAAGPEIAAALSALDDYDVIAITSANGAEAFAARLAEAGRAVPATAWVMAVGAATAAALTDAGIRVDTVPAVATGTALAAELAARGLRGARVLLPRARIGRPELPAALRAAGAHVDDVAFYDTVPVRPEPAEVAAALPADAVVLTSPSAVAVLAEVAGPRIDGLRAITIGPTTSAAARAAGIAVLAEAGEQSVDGLVAAAIGCLRPGTAG